MSTVAEYAAQLHKKEPKIASNRPSFSIEVAQNIKAIIFDIYATLINFCPLNFANDDEKKEYQLSVFLRTAKEFAFFDTLKKIDENTAPQITLANFYAGLLLTLQERDEKNGKKFSEPQVFEVWNLILSILINNGYEIDKFCIGTRDEFAKCIAYFFHLHSFGRSSLFENCGKTLLELKSRNIKLGLLANTQFYATLELSLYLREDGICEDYLDLFDKDLCFFSYDLKMTKQSGVLHRKLFDALYDLQILPRDTMFVSANKKDLDYAKEIGLS
ncbi:MAG: hypothetical protein FWF51_08675 [Chitinivibrionia bacterium]|nr:hypothetical protein [Chitinivibrionia bacterium]